MNSINSHYIIVMMLFFCTQSFAETESKALYSDNGLVRESCKVHSIKAKSSKPKIVNFCDCAPGHLPYIDRGDSSGDLDIRFDVGENNNLIDARILKSSGYKNMDVAAFEAQRKCKFQSAFRDGKPVRAEFTMRYFWDIDIGSFSMTLVK